MDRRDEEAEPARRRPWYRVPLWIVGLLALSVGPVVCSERRSPPRIPSPRLAPGEAPPALAAGWGITWVTLPGGTFRMGAESESAEAAERPAHSVLVPSFEMMKSEVTVAMYRACVAAGRCGEPAGADRACNWAKPGREDHPINCVAWTQARDFCVAAQARLPSEAEWEFAASGGELRMYPWGGEAVDAGGAYRANYNGYDTPRRRKDDRAGRDGHEQTAPVCSYPRGASRHGLCDLAGNVTEWVEDCYHPSYVNAPGDGSAWVKACERTAYIQDCNGLESHGLRGGGWHSWSASLRTTYQSNTHPWEQGPGVGFRCARPPRR